MTPASEAAAAGVPLLVHENWRWQTPIRALKAALDRIRSEAEDAVRQGYSHLILTDERIGRSFAAVPMILAAGGGKLRACTFFIGGKPGVCMSTLVDDIAKHASELQQDSCKSDERCAPCVNPLDGKDTGLCGGVGVYEGDCTAGASEAPARCCHGAGVCMTPDGIPEDSRGDMKADSCVGGRLCAPASLVGGAPVKCDALGLSGVCLDVCFAAELRGTAPVTRSSCGPTEVCLPCAIGGPRGMPGCN